MNEIRLAELGDISFLSELLDILFGQDIEFTANELNQTKALEMIINNPEFGQIFVMLENDRIIGMVSLLYSISTALGGKVAILEDMIMHPEYRNKNNGSKLLDHALSFAKETGLKRITLLTDFDNDGAKSFYKKHGFEKSAMDAFRLIL